MIQFPADLGDDDPEIVFHVVMYGFTVEVGIARDYNYTGGVSCVVVGGIYQKGYIVIGSCAANDPSAPIVETLTSEHLRRMPYMAAQMIARSMFIDLQMNVAARHTQLRIDALVARTYQMNPALRDNAYQN